MSGVVSMAQYARSHHVYGHGADKRGLKTRYVLGVNLVDASTSDTVRALENGEARKVFFFNAHCSNIQATDKAYARAIARADCVLPDGIGIDIAARMTGEPLAENLNGTDFTPVLLQQAELHGQSVFLFGASPGTAETAAARLVEQFPGLKIAGTRDGFSGLKDSAEAVAQINASGADILLVALGVPIQELWIDEHADALSPSIILGVGALFDFLSGNVSRAPKLVRWLRCEWIWRLALEPKRLARRYLIGNLVFLIRALFAAVGQMRLLSTIRRVFDIIGSSAALIMLSPLFLILAMIIRLESAGPAFFKQTRIGRNGRPFTIYKFRTMSQDAEIRRAGLEMLSDRAGICFKAHNDPRVTRSGRWLRRFSVDELPQLFNVLKGEMSLIGPRPALPKEVAAYPSEARPRLDAKPGLTGLWQVSGRADIGFDRMVAMDIAYVRSHSILLDLIVLLLTVRAIMSGRGAY